MKILAIIGSPRKKGNTYRVVEQIREHIMAFDESIDWEYLFLRDCNLLMCMGCFACFAHGKDKCPLQADDHALIESKMSDADGIIFAAPSYAMGVPGIMKNFIDRFAYTCHRPCFFDKVIMPVTTVGGIMGMKQALAQLAILSGGGRLVKKLGVPSPPIPMIGFEQKAKKNIQKASKALYSALVKQERKLPGLGDWAWFHSFKSFCADDSYCKVSPADYSYYKDKEEYFYPLSGHYLRRLSGKVLKHIMRISMGFLIDKKSGVNEVR